MRSSRTTVPVSLLLSLLLLVILIWPGPAASPYSVALAQSEDACPRLPPPTGNVVTVSTVNQLVNAVNSATSGTTIFVNDGIYYLDGDYLRFDVPGVTLRSVSGDRQAVVLDGDYVTTEIIQIVASNVTIADLTLREAYYHPIHVMSTDDGNTDNTRIYNVHIVDPGQQAIKINPHEARTYFTDNGLVACSHIELTDAGRAQVWTINGRCYTGGVDGHWARGWVIRDNVIQGFWCEGDGNGCRWQDLSEHAIHFWTGSRDTVVERNTLTDNARGVGFGLGSSGSGRTYVPDPCPSASGYVGHFDGIVRNNFVFAERGALLSSDCGFDCGICLEQACGTQVLHNTVVSTQAPFSSIEWRFSNTDADIINNLVSHNLQERDGASAFLSGNLPNGQLSLFVDGANGDLHLAPTATSAIDEAVSVAAGLCEDDIDGDTRPIGSARDIGADEYGIAPPAAVTDLRVPQAVTATGVLTATLVWTAPPDAVTTTLRYADAFITGANWAGASLISDTLPGATDTFTAVVPYSGGMVYFALKTQNSEGDPSALSNNAFWPSLDVFLPLVMKSG